MSPKYCKIMRSENPPVHKGEYEYQHCMYRHFLQFLPPLPLCITLCSQYQPRKISISHIRTATNHFCQPSIETGLHLNSPTLRNSANIPSAPRNNPHQPPVIADSIFLFTVTLPSCSDILLDLSVSTRAWK